MLKTALNNNIIPHTWKLANIVPIPKPNKDIDKGTSYRPISLLSVIAKTLEKSLWVAPIAQLVSALDLLTSSVQVEGSILTAGKRLSLKNLNVIIWAIN